MTARRTGPLRAPLSVMSTALLLAGLAIGLAVTAAPARACGIHAVSGSTETAVGFTPAKVSMSVWVDSCDNSVYASSTSFKDSGGYYFKGKEAISLDVINPPGGP